MPPIRPTMAKTTSLEKALAQLPYVHIEPRWDHLSGLLYRAIHVRIGFRLDSRQCYLTKHLGVPQPAFASERRSPRVWKLTLCDHST